MNCTGFSLVELLVVSAVIGLLVLASASLFAQIHSDLDLAESMEGEFLERWGAIRRLRADIARAAQAEGRGSDLILNTDTEEVIWRCRADGLTRAGNRHREYFFSNLACKFWVESQGPSTQVRVSLLDSRPLQMVVSVGESEPPHK